MAIYLDNSATTQPCEAAIQAAEDALRTHWHNPSSLYRPAMEAEKLMNQARATCLRAVHAQGHRLVFTGSGTEADNLAILGYLKTVRKPGRVLISQVEHPAVAACAQEIGRLGHRVENMAVDRRGVVDLEKLEAQLGEDVRMICVMQVNNDTGAVMPLQEIVTLRNRLSPEAAIHVDGVQGFLRVPIRFSDSGIQSYAFSGHKIHAPKGIAGLVVRREARLAPIQFGGGQEEGWRSGTENVPGILAMAAAVEAFPADGVAHMAEMKRRLWDGLRAAIPTAELNGPEPGTPESAPHILNVSVQPVRSQTMLFALEGEGVYISAGSACSSHRQKVSAALTAMGCSTQRADCALRFSLCPAVTAEMIDATVDAVRRQYEALSAYVRK